MGFWSWFTCPLVGISFLSLVEGGACKPWHNAAMKLKLPAEVNRNGTLVEGNMLVVVMY